MLDKQAGFGSFVGLAVLALGLFSWLQGAGGLELDAGWCVDFSSDRGELALGKQAR